jgi:hypothetical protein
VAHRHLRQLALAADELAQRGTALVGHSSRIRGRASFVQSHVGRCRPNPETDRADPAHRSSFARSWRTPERCAVAVRLRLASIGMTPPISTPARSSAMGCARRRVSGMVSPISTASIAGAVVCDRGRWR